MAVSLFHYVQIAKALEVLVLTEEYNRDNFSNKVNLVFEGYRKDDGKPWVLPVVRAVEASLAADETLNHEYLGVAGMKDFCEPATKLLLGDDSPSVTQKRVQGIQCLGGTGAMRVAADFMHKHLGCNVAYISKQTFGTHRGIFEFAGYTVKEYRYWNAETRSLDFDGLCEDFNNAPEKAVMVLHGFAHNPTGVDPTEEQWRVMAEIIKAKKLVVLVDQAYQGFRNFDKDAWAVRFLEGEGLEFFIAQSFSETFGLYDEPVGNLIVISNSRNNIPQVKSQLEMIARTMWPSPPSHGARIVSTVFQTNRYFTDWKEQVKQMEWRIRRMRETLLDKLLVLGCPGTWSHITAQKGMFSYTGLSVLYVRSTAKVNYGRGNLRKKKPVSQVQKLKSKHHIYLLKSGRINMCGLTTRNIDYVAAAITEVVREELEVHK